MSSDKFHGNERALNFVRRSLERKALSHSLLVTGEKGLGKRTFARALAKALNCEKGSFFEPCGCTSCAKADSGNHPDVRWYGLAEDKNKVKLAEVKDLIHWISFKPFEAKMKVFIVNDAHDLTIEAQNALLKTLEEPPPQSQLILLTDHRSLLLETIVSRCVEIKLEPPPETAEHLEESRRLIRQWTQTGSWEFFGVEMGRSREELRELVDILIRYLRDVLIYKEIPEKNRLFFPQELPRIQEISRLRSSEELIGLLKDLIRVRESLEDNLNQKIVANYVATKLEENLF